MPLARHARALWQVELCLCAVPALGGARVWDALLETLVELGLTDHWQHMIDSTTVRGHSQAAGAKGGTHKEGFGRSRGDFTSKVHARTEVKDVLLALS